MRRANNVQLPRCACALTFHFSFLVFCLRQPSLFVSVQRLNPSQSTKWLLSARRRECLIPMTAATLRRRCTMPFCRCVRSRLILFPVFTAWQSVLSMPWIVCHACTPLMFLLGNPLQAHPPRVFTCLLVPLRVQIKTLNPNSTGLAYFDQLLTWPVYRWSALVNNHFHWWLKNATGTVIRLKADPSFPQPGEGMVVPDYTNATAAATFVSVCVNATQDKVVDGIYIGNSVSMLPACVHASVSRTCVNAARSRRRLCMPVSNLGAPVR